MSPWILPDTTPTTTPAVAVPPSGGGGIALPYTSIADRLVEATQPFWSQDMEDYLRAIGAMFAQLESYAADPDEPDTDVFIYRPNWAPNPDFEHDQIGSAPAAWGTPTFSSGGTVDQFRVTGAWHYRGAQSLHLRALTVPAGQSVFTANDPSVVPVVVGQPWRLAASFNILSANTQAVVQLDFFYPSGTHLATMGVTLSAAATGVQRIATPPIPAPIGAAFVAATVGLTNAGGSTATVDGYIDAVMLQQGWPILMDPFNGDDAGNEWAGIPGNSSSVQVSAVPQVGWSKMLDVERADGIGLPYLAQLVGERFPIGLADAAQRQWIKKSPNQWRGTMQAIADGVIPLLTGSQSVFMRERSKLDLTTDPDWLAIITFASETPNQQVVIDQLRRKLVPADINIDYAAASQETWSVLEGGHTWTVVESGAPTWHQVESISAGYIPPGFTLWIPSP